MEFHQGKKLQVTLWHDHLHDMTPSLYDMIPHYIIWPLTLYYITTSLYYITTSLYYITTSLYYITTSLYYITTSSYYVITYIILCHFILFCVWGIWFHGSGNLIYGIHIMLCDDPIMLLCVIRSFVGTKAKYRWRLMYYMVTYMGQCILSNGPLTPDNRL